MYIVYPHFGQSLNWHLADSVVPKESRGSKSFENLVISTISQKREPSKNSDYAQLSANIGHFMHKKVPYGFNFIYRSRIKKRGLLR